MAHRERLVKTRHIGVQYLWAQREVKEKMLTVKKVSTNNNPADLPTKALNGEKVMKYVADIGFDVISSRANTAPTP